MEASTAAQTGQLQHFACPVCGRLRPLGAVARKERRLGQSSGECQKGTGCRTKLDDPELLKRFWLIQAAGVPEVEVRRAGGAAGYVREHGLPDLLHALASVLPADAELIANPHGSLE